MVVGKAASFHQRALPSPPATAFSSESGRLKFREALLAGYVEGYFLLAEQFRTQDEPAFCGLSTLVMLLNALQGPWRWYHESMLDCCEDLEKVKKQGISFRQFVCLAQCHGLAVIPKRPQQDTTMSYECCCVETPEDSPSTPLQDSEENQPAERRLLTKVVPIQTSLAAFREDVQECCRSAQLPMLIVSYSRKEFKQTGDGHFSPIAAFHEESDHVLILDTARFKYPSHWVPLELLYAAMMRVDPSTGKQRGWVVVTDTHARCSDYSCGVGSAEEPAAGPAKGPGGCRADAPADGTEPQESGPQGRCCRPKDRKEHEREEGAVEPTVIKIGGPFLDASNVDAPAESAQAEGVGKKDPDESGSSPFPNDALPLGVTPEKDLTSPSLVQRFLERDRIAVCDATDQEK